MICEIAQFLGDGRRGRVGALVREEPVDGQNAIGTGRVCQASGGTPLDV